MTASTKPTDWYKKFFEDFRLVFDLRPKKMTTDQVRHVMKKLNLKKGSKFLDSPCGIGRIALPLAIKGIKVTGVDITQSYLDEFQKKADRRGLKVNLLKSDMRRINFKNRFDAGANLWTSIGYFEKESDNFLVIKKMFQALKKGGKFMLSTLNRDWLMLNFEASGWYEVGGMKVLEKRGFEYDKSISTSRWYFLKDGKEIIHDTRIRMYSYHELLAMFRKAGFVDIEGYSGEKEEPIDRNSRMLYIIGMKP